MTVSSAAAPSFGLRDIVASVAPVRGGFDPLGLVSGYRMYRIYTALAGRSDAELAALGIARSEIPRIASDAVFRAA